METLASALSAWRNTLGAEHVITDEARLQEAQSATFLTTQRVPAIIRPAHHEEVQQCVKIANAWKVPLYPISAGKNWGYGSRVPACSDNVILDLSRMRRILDFDEKLAYVTVEPGVTVSQLLAFLREHHSQLRVSITGSTLHASLIGNVLERGLGSGAYADRFAYVCGFEVVLPTGECARTGFGRFPQAASAACNRWGVGPYLDGLFTQSNLGIVTRMTIWLMPASTHLLTCAFSLRHSDALAGIIELLQTLKFNGIITAPVHLRNDYKMLSTLMQCPPRVLEAQSFLRPENLAHIRKVLNFGAWNGEVLLSFSDMRLCRTIQEILQDTLENRVDQLYFKQREDGFDIDERHEMLSSLGSLLQERLMPESDFERLRMVYWRKKMEVLPFVEPDPDRDRCGVIWCAPSVPFNGVHVAQATGIIEEICLAHGFEPNISILCMTERDVIVNAALLYDREVQGEDERAMLCYHSLIDRLAKAGYFPYRLGIQGMSALPPAVDDSGFLFHRLKCALDPNDILATGRYDFRGDWPETGL